MTTIPSYDLIVIGSGPAGYSAAIRATQLSARVVLIDRAAAGGTCLNWGCIPTKFLWETLYISRRIQRARDYGLAATSEAPVFVAVQQKKQRLVENLSKGLLHRIERYGIISMNGTARFTATRTIEVTAADGSTRSISAEKIIIAAGSRPIELPGLPFDHTRIIDSADALALREVPPDLLIVGGGAIGVEMAVLFAGFGSAVTLIEREPQVLPGEDADLAAEVKKSIERLGVAVHTGVVDSTAYTAAAEKILVVTGRRANSDTLNLAAAGIEQTRTGVTVNEFLETTQPGVYAAGDCAGRGFLAYTAQMEGVLAAENAFNAAPRAVAAAPVPRVVFSVPAAASVGARGIAPDPATIITGTFPVAANARAFIDGERTGWVKVTADRVSRRLLAVHMIGPAAEEIIATASLALQQGLRIDDLRRESFFHPSLSELFLAACESAAGTCVECDPPVPGKK